MTDDAQLDAYQRRNGELAMVSRIRVEVRGGSMEAAERVAFLMLDHARMAGYLEGVVPSSSEYTDHFFNYPQVTGKPSDGPDPWSELGLRYAGRMAVSFEPEVAIGGLKQFGYEVSAPETGTDENSLDVTDEVLVLQRVQKVERDSDLLAKIEIIAPEAPPDGEAVLDNIRRLVNVDRVEVGSVGGPDDQPLWVVRAFFSDERQPVAGAETSLLEASLACYVQCGTEVTHYDTKAPPADTRKLYHDGPPPVSDDKLLDERIAGV